METNWITSAVKDWGTQRGPLSKLTATHDGNKIASLLAGQSDLIRARNDSHDIRSFQQGAHLSIPLIDPVW